MAPARAEAGRRNRWSGPQIMRTRWGTTSPTKPISPLTETTAPVIKEAKTKAIFLTLSTSTPSSEAVSSPKATRFRSFAREKRTALPRRRYRKMPPRDCEAIYSRFPISQKVTLKRRSSLVQEIRNMMMARKKALTMNPARSMVCAGTRPLHPRKKIDKEQGQQGARKGRPRNRIAP